MTHRPPATRQSGFTLVELLVSLMIFGMLSAAGVALLSFSVRAQDLADERLGQLAKIRRAGALLNNDIAQATRRISRGETGAAQRAFTGEAGGGEGSSLLFVRRGWHNFDDAQRPSLQKVEYRLADGQLERRAFGFVDGSAPLEPVILLEGVTRFNVRYQDERGQWRERWDPADPTRLPRAVEVVMEIKGSGTIRQLFLAGARS